MKEISLHILDIVQNSTRAQATEVGIEIVEDLAANLMNIEIKDNGCGMNEEKLATITHPFSTSRTTRRVGLGLSLFQAAAERCNGSLTIQSESEKGTTISVVFEHNHIDRAPLGDIVTTMVGLMIGNPDTDFCYRHSVNGSLFNVDTKEIKQELGEVPITEISVIHFLTEYMQSHLEALYKETNL